MERRSRSSSKRAADRGDPIVSVYDEANPRRTANVMADATLSRHASAKSWSNPAPRLALEYSALAIRNYHDVGNTTTMRGNLAWLAACLDWLGRHEAAATIAGFALSPLTALAYPEITLAIAHLRDVLGDETFESFARNGVAMTTSAMVTYAYDQIDQARAELNAVSK